jgi:hypothetical protein
MTCVSTPRSHICLQDHNGAPMFHHLWQPVEGEPILLRITKILCTFSHVHVCVHLLNCFCTHLKQMFWYPRSSVMMKYAHLQLMPNLSAVSVTVISIFLNHSINMFNAVCCLWSGQIVWAVFINDGCFATMEPFHPTVHLPLCNTVFPVLC